MDFMKVFDQAVREIKREVNLKVLKVPEIEQKVLDATNDEPWGPHGSALAEIAQATKKFTECQMIMNVLWTRLTDTGPNWRHVYKALSVIEYLVANGSERAVDDILEHTFQISSLSSFEYAEPSGKDVGLNVRKKVETILALVNDNEKIQAVRNKASANRDKYFGLSSTGISYKSSQAAYGSSSFQKNERYGGFNDAKEDDTFRGSYKDTDDQYRDDQEKMKKSYTNVTKGTKLKMGESRPQSELKPSEDHATFKSSSSEMNTSADDFDDFDPRDSTSAEASTTNVKQVDLFGDSLIGDLMDVPTTISSEPTNMNAGSAEEFDLFAGATFVSASSHKTGGQNDQSDFFSEQPSVVTSSASVDLFSTPDSCAANGAKMDLFSIPDSGILTGVKTSMPVMSSSEHFDPFAAVPLNPSEESDLYGAFTSNTDSASQEQLESSGSHGPGPGNLNSTILSKPGQKKEGFQVKSGIWADSLSRGLIDLNLTAPKKVALSDVGVVGGLVDGSDDTRHTALYTGRGIGAASGHGKSAFPYPSGSRASGGFPDFGL